MSWDEFVECCNKGHEFLGRIDEHEFSIVNKEDMSAFIFNDSFMCLNDFNAKHFVIYQGKTLYELFENGMVELIEMF